MKNVFLSLIFIITIVYVFINIFIKTSREKKELLFLRLSFIILFLTLMFRKPFSDLIGYISAFKYFAVVPFDKILSNRMEIGYKLLTLFIGKISLNERFFIFIIDIINCIGPYYFIKKYSKNYYLSVLLYISIGTYRMNFWLFRQAIAVSILLFSLKFIEKKKIFPFLLLLFLAVLFHKSSFVFIILYFICNCTSKKFNKFLFPLMIISAYMFRHEICSFLMQIEYTEYLGSIYAVSGEGYFRLLIYISLLLFYLFFKNKEKSTNENMFVNMVFVCILFQVLASNVAIITRLSCYFSMALTILPSNVISNLKNRNSRIIITSVSVLVIILYVFLINPMPEYSFFWVD